MQQKQEEVILGTERIAGGVTGKWEVIVLEELKI